MNTPRRVAITIGDPAGIGPEIVLKSLLSREVAGQCTPVVIGDRAVLAEAASALNLSIDPSAFELVECGAVTGGFEKGRPTALGGSAAVAYVKKAVELVMERRADAMVTAPISKEALKLAGYPWPGHTELLAELTGTRDFAMMLAGGPLRVILVTIHAAIRQVPDLVTKERVLKTIGLAERACSMLGIEQPRIAVAALNPHAGEAGIFGSEDFMEILPAVKEAQLRGISASGPYPADALFHKAYKGEFDIVVCMYHDQGLVPLKMIAFDTGVNVTVGLPLVRTSPDHGTAYDIAWKGVAGPSSMIEAITMAVRMKNAARRS